MLAEYDFKVTYWEGKKNSVNDLLRKSDYKLSKAASTLTITEIVQQSFCLRSKDYKSVQKKLYTFTAMTLQLKHSVHQLQQDNIVISTANTEDSDITETSAVHNLHTQKVCCNKYNTSISNTEDDDIIKTSAVHHLHAQQASHNENDKSVMSEDSDMTETSAVCDLSAWEASCNDESVMSETDDMTETSAVHYQYAQRASCVMSEKISDVTEAHTVQHLSA